MNFKNIFEMQRLLDKAIMSAHNTDKQNFIREKRIAALLVELGEFANEYAPFKYWKKNKTVDEAKLIEEFVDGIHFFSSIAIELNASFSIDPAIINEDQSLQLVEVYKQVVKLLDDYSDKQLVKAFSLYMGLARQLSISDKQIEDFYINKNKINYERIKNNY